MKDITTGEEIFDNKQRLSVKLEYDKNGREVLRKFGNGTSETTLYDKAGRVTVKAQKSDRGELQWAEGYLYGEDGKRTATVDNKGFVTLYEYNKKGQLETVWYPYSQEMINLLKEEAEENGLPVNAEPGENRYLSSDIKDNLVRLMNSMQFGISGSISNLQIFIKESYGYDKNGNRTSKTTKYGTINYNYDKENCLLSSGSRGQSFVNYTYDNMGNLLTEESALKSTKYAYNSQNRLIYCEVTDRSKKEYSQTTYAYDAFGRRILVQDKGEATLRTLYDGLTFDVIKQSPSFENGLFTDSQNTGIQWERTGKPTGERYRYISDENTKDDTRYVYLDENAYRIKNTRYTGERTQISVNGTLAAQSSSEGNQYFTTDLFGSVSTVSDSYGYQLDSYTYDAFGSLVQGDLSGATDCGYLGKQNDPTSRFYNYGYRDYKPQAARFTTVDPIRDGTNWFAYVNNDPVNFVDLWGLSALSSTIKLFVKGVILHYGRNTKQKDYVYQNKEDALQIGYQQLGIDKGEENAEQLDRYHEMGKLPDGYDDPSGNDKYVMIDPRNPKASFELVYDKSGNLVTDSINRGTYNYWNPDGFIGSVMHGICDVLPYYVLGNSPTDFFTTTIFDRITGNYDRDIPDPTKKDDNKEKASNY